MADYRLSGAAEETLVEILEWSEENFYVAGRQRYAALAIQAMQDVADDPTRPGVHWIEIAGRSVGVYSFERSKGRVPDPPGRVKEPRHHVVFRVGDDRIIDILGFIHDRMLKGRALRRILGGQ